MRVPKNITRLMRSSPNLRLHKEKRLLEREDCLSWNRLQVVQRVSEILSFMRSAMLGWVFSNVAA